MRYFLKIGFSMGRLICWKPDSWKSSCSTPFEKYASDLNYTHPSLRRKLSSIENLRTCFNETGTFSTDMTDKRSSGTTVKQDSCLYSRKVFHTLRHVTTWISCETVRTISVEGGPHLHYLPEKSKELQDIVTIWRAPTSYQIFIAVRITRVYSNISVVAPVGSADYRGDGKYKPWWHQD